MGLSTPMLRQTGALFTLLEWNVLEDLHEDGGKEQQEVWQGTHSAYSVCTHILLAQLYGKLCDPLRHQGAGLLLNWVPRRGASRTDWSSTDPVISRGVRTAFLLRRIQAFILSLFFFFFCLCLKKNKKKNLNTLSLKHSLAIWPEVSFLDEWGDPRGNQWNKLCKAYN